MSSMCFSPPFFLPFVICFTTRGHACVATCGRALCGVGCVQASKGDGVADDGGRSRSNSAYLDGVSVDVVSSALAVAPLAVSHAVPGGAVDESELPFPAPPRSTPTGKYSCGSVCGAWLDCGFHRCTDVCHGNDCVGCQLLPGRVAYVGTCTAGAHIVSCVSP